MGCHISCRPLQTRCCSQLGFTVLRLWYTLSCRLSPVNNGGVSQAWACCHNNWRYHPLCFLICSKLCIIWSLLQSVILTHAAAIQKSMTEQINLGDELLFLQYYHAFEEILKRTDLFLWFIELLKLGIFCDRMYIVSTVEIIEISNVWLYVCEQPCLATHKASLTDSFSVFTSMIQHYSTQ